MEKKFMKLSNKETLAYLDEGKGKETIVLVHGNMSSSVHYKPLIERLKDHYRLIVPDMRGFGDSTYHQEFNDLEDLSDDLILLLDTLGIGAYYVVGWSTGGAVALKMAVKQPKQVKKVILIESCSYRGYPVFKKDELGQAIVGSFYPTKEELALDAVQVKPIVDVLAAKATSIMKAVCDQVIYSLNKPSKEDDDLYLAETMKERCLLDIDWALTRFNMSDTSNGVAEGDGTIKDVVCPVLSFWSDTDYVVLEYMVDETVAALGDATKVTIEKSGHSPLVDAPDILTKRILEFIQ